MDLQIRALQSASAGDSPLVTMIGLDDDCTDELTRSVEAAGARVHRRLDRTSARDWVDDQRVTDAVFVGIGGSMDTSTLDLLSMLSRDASKHHRPTLMHTRIEALDEVAAHVDGPYVTLLCEPHPEEQLAAVSLALSEARAGFSDLPGEMDPQRLRRLADEVGRIARTLAALSGPRPSSMAATAVEDAPFAYRAEPLDTAETSGSLKSDDIRRLLRLRRLRDNYFDGTLFADPAWDMLLDLMAARLEQAQVAVSSLCIAAAVPPTTALRWIKALTDNGMFERCADPDDGRRIFIRLSDPAAALMTRYLTAAQQMGGLAI
jgi:DNA-binding MarR family transcriptional regulator